MTGSLQVKNNKYYAVINLSYENGKRKLKWIFTGFSTKDGKIKAERALRRLIADNE